MSAAGDVLLSAWRGRLEALERLRQGLGYRETLRRGYAVVYGDGAVATRRSQAERAKSIEIEFADGRLTLGGRAGRKAKPKVPGQGSLF